MPSHCFCEAIHAGPVRQPANAASSLAFLVVAAVAVAHARRLRRASRAEAAAHAALFAVAAAAVGAGSAFYHASLSFWGQTADVLGMYLVATLFLLQAWTRRRALPPWRAAAVYLAANAALLAALVVVPTLRRWVFAALVVGIVAVETGAPRRDRRDFAAALALLAVGFALWTLDITGVLCAPRSALQGHAVWHLCSAAATWLGYRHFAALGAVDAVSLPGAARGGAAR
jgi:hypothetical protein